MLHWLIKKSSCRETSFRRFRKPYIEFKIVWKKKKKKIETEDVKTAQRVVHCARSLFHFHFGFFFFSFFRQGFVYAFTSAYIRIFHVVHLLFKILGFFFSSSSSSSSSHSLVLFFRKIFGKAGQCSLFEDARANILSLFFI